jgi:hypothetical protein
MYSNAMKSKNFLSSTIEINNIHKLNILKHNFEVFSKNKKYPLLAYFIMLSPNNK